MITNTLDIVNSKKWDNAEWLNYFQQRLNIMRGARSDIEAEWTKNDEAYNARSFYQNWVELIPIIPLEKILIEIYIGRTKWMINFDVKSEWQTNINELQPSRFILNHVLDWSYDENFWEENKQLKVLKALYWNGIFYTWPRERKDYRYKIKDNNVKDVFAESNYKKEEHSEWHLFPKNIHIKDFYIDDNALGQPSIQYADDCVLKEKISASELELRYGNNPQVDKKALAQVGYMTDLHPRNKDDTSIEQEELMIYTYWNKVTKDFMVVANEEHLLIKNKYLYDDGKLPFTNIQHYYNPNSFYTEGLPSRVSYLKASKSNLFLDLLTWAEMASWVNLIVWNDDQIGQSWEVWGSKINLWRTTGGAENVRPVSSNINLWAFEELMNFVDREIAIVTWINPSEQITASSDILWIVEINEANKAVRTGSIDESYEIGIDNTLTMTLARITQFASLLWEVKTDDDWNFLKNIPKKISIPWFKMVKRNGKDVIEEEENAFGELTIEAKNLKAWTVKIITNSTNAVLPIIERKKVDTFIETRLKLAQTAQLDATGKSMAELVESTNMKQLIEWTNDAYWIDNNDLKYNTKTDKIRHTNEKKMEELKEALTLKTEQNAPATQNPMSGQIDWELNPWEQGIEGGEQQPWLAL